MQSDDSLKHGYKSISFGGGISNGVQLYVFKRITIDVLIGFGILKPVSYHVLYGNYGPFDKSYYINSVRAALNLGYTF